MLSVNTSLEDKPEAINFDPTDTGWFFKLAPDDAGELDQYMDEDTYQEFIKEL